MKGGHAGGGVLLDSRTISRMGLAAVVLIALLAGLLGNHQIVRSLEHEYTQRSLDASRALAGRLQDLRANTAPETASGGEADAALRQLAQAYQELGGARIYLLDANPDGSEPDAELIPDTALAVAAAAATSPLSEAWKLEQSRERFTYAVQTGTADGWMGMHTLVVITDMADLFSAMHRVHYRVSALLVLAVGGVGVASFFSLRRLGLGYEGRLEAALRTRTAELEDAHAEMLHKARLATLGQTASMLAHEIRNPLASIKFGLTGLQGRGMLPERDQHRLAIILREVDRLNGLLSDALQYARPIRLGDQPQALQDLLERVTGLLDPMLRSHGIRLSQPVAADCPPIHMDAGQMQQALVNLLKNAIEASPEGSTVNVRLGHGDGAVWCAVHNEGPPIPLAQQQRLFEPFNTSKPSGTGLGLTLVRRVVEEHGGNVEWSSSAAAGTLFRIRLPM